MAPPIPTGGSSLGRIALRCRAFGRSVLGCRAFVRRAQPRAPSQSTAVRAGTTLVGFSVVVLVAAASLVIAAGSTTAEAHLRPAATPALALAPVLGLADTDATPSDGCRRPWVAPVDASVADPFRPPGDRYGPGNRGIEYRTASGQPVRAVDGGVVSFAGPVAGRPVVVIDHGAQLRSSYVQLLDHAVTRDQVVIEGQVIARADTGFHLGARRGDRYIDPAELFERTCERVRLVAPNP